MRDMIAKGRGGASSQPEKFRGHTPPHFKGSAHPRAKLSEATVRALRARLKAGEAIRAIARETGLDRKSLMDMRDRKTWAHVPD
jgi:hypothetical protein